SLPVGPAVVDPPVGSIVVFFPARFGSNELAILASEVLSWPGGLAPAGIQGALRHEMKRRSLRHADMADRVGVSRAQYANILQGVLERAQRSPPTSGNS